MLDGKRLFITYLGTKKVAEDFRCRINKAKMVVLTITAHLFCFLNQ